MISPRNFDQIASLYPAVQMGVQGTFLPAPQRSPFPSFLRPAVFPLPLVPFFPPPLARTVRGERGRGVSRPQGRSCQKMREQVEGGGGGEGRKMKGVKGFPSPPPSRLRGETGGTREGGREDRRRSRISAKWKRRRRRIVRAKRPE